MIWNCSNVYFAKAENFDKATFTLFSVCGATSTQLAFSLQSINMLPDIFTEQQWIELKKKNH